MSSIITTTTERVQFLRNRIAERRSFAAEMRGKAIGATVSEAAACLDQAKQAESHAHGSEIALLVLFP